jgi:Flp pilus assembly CpaE family ATPase
MCSYVVIDGPTRHDPGGRCVLDASDFNLMIVQLLVTNVRNADRMIQELATQGFNPDRISLVYNRLGRESAHLTLDQVETILGHKMFASVSDDWKTVSASVNIGQPLRQHCEKSKVRREIRHLAMLLHSPETLAASTSKQGGLLGRLLGKTSATTSGQIEPVEGALKPATQG